RWQPELDVARARDVDRHGARALVEATHRAGHLVLTRLRCRLSADRRTRGAAGHRVGGARALVRDGYRRSEHHTYHCAWSDWPHDGIPPLCWIKSRHRAQPSPGKPVAGHLALRRTLHRFVERPRSEDPRICDVAGCLIWLARRKRGHRVDSSACGLHHLCVAHARGRPAAPGVVAHLRHTDARHRRLTPDVMGLVHPLRHALTERSWTLTRGAAIVDDGVRFEVWAPHAQRVG